jgi:hypothetical protein
MYFKCNEINVLNVPNINYIHNAHFCVSAGILFYYEITLLENFLFQLSVLHQPPAE